MAWKVSRWRDAGALALLLLFTLAFFKPIFTGRSFSTVAGVQNAVYPWAAHPSSTPIPIQSDQASLSYGWAAFEGSSVRNGVIPFWDPHTFGGTPHLANGSTAALGPIRLLTDLVSGLGWAHDLYSLIVVIGGGICAYGLARHLGLRRAGSALAATAWMLSGWNLAWLHLEVVSPVILFFPALMWALSVAIKRGSAASLLAAAVTVAMTLTSIHILFALITIYLCGLYGAGLVVAPLLHRRQRDRPTAQRRAARLGIATGGGLCLSAPMVIPTFATLRASQRAPMTYATLLHLWIASPGWFLSTFSPPHAPLSQQVFNTRLAFAGTATAILAIVGLRAWRSRPVIVGGLLMAGIFAVAVGTPLTWLAFHLAPGMNVFRPYARLEMWWALGLGLLGGAGLDLLLGWIRRHHVKAAAIVGLVVVIGTGAQLVRYGRSTNPRFPERNASQFFPRTPLIDAIARDSTLGNGWPARIVSLSAPVIGSEAPALSANIPLVFGFDTIGGYDSTVSRRTFDIVRILAGANVTTIDQADSSSAFEPNFLATTTRVALLARLGISRVVLTPALHLDAPNLAALRKDVTGVRYTGSDGTLLDLAPSGPVVVGATTVSANATDALHAFLAPGFDRRRTVIVEPDQVRRLGRIPLPNRPGQSGVVLHAARGTNSETLSVDAQRPSWLVIPENWDVGWSATVNGTSATVVRADYQQRAVLVPSGRSTVTLQYRPKGWTAGVALGAVSWLAVIVMCGVMIVARRRRARSGTTADSPVAA